MFIQSRMVSSESHNLYVRQRAIRCNLPAPIMMTVNDLECPIHLIVRFTGGTLDVRMLWLSELTMRDCMTVGLNCQRQKCGQ